jgi:hypothetical protein
MFFAGLSEDECRKLCKTRASGTHLYNVREAFATKGIHCYIASINQDYADSLEHLVGLSHHFPLVLSCEFRDRFHAKGRDAVRHHAIVMQNGYVFDPAERAPMPLEAFECVFNKKLTVKQMLIVDVENENYGKRKVA